MKLEELERIWDLPPGELAAMMKTILGENASPEEMEAALMDIMGNIETMMQRSYTLEECLSFPTKEDLVELAKALKLKGYSKMRKEELQHFLYSYLTKPDYMYRIYPALSNGEVELLNQLSASNIPLISTDMMFCVSGLIQNGLCYLDEYGKHLLIPEELKTAFLNVQADASLQKQQKENSVFYDICNTAVYFYGIYPMAELCQLIQRKLYRPISEENLIHWYTHSAIYREEFFFKNGYIISAALRNAPEDVIALQQIQKMKKRTFWPDAEAMEILSIEQWLIEDQYYEPFWDCAPFLMENEFGDVMSVSRFVEASIRTGATFDSLMGFLSEQIFAFESMEQINEFIQIMMNIWNNTPMWENCGYSLAQIKRNDMKKNKPQNNVQKGTVISLAEHRAKKKNK